MKKKSHIFKKVFLFILFFTLSLHTGTVLYSDSPNIKRLTGVNWFGFETGDYVVHGLWARDYRSMLRQIKDLDFNCLRIPFSNEMLDKYPRNITSSEYMNDPYTGQRGINMDLAGKSSLEVLDAIINEADRLGLRIILDCHSRAANGFYTETLWYTPECPESRWISDWVFLTRRYLYSDAVIGFDLNNEPHGGLFGMGMKPPASWGYDVPGFGITNWKAAAERCAAAILQVNPDIIIIIQGVQESQDGSNYWWGSNHKDLRTYPVTSIPSHKIMFSVHEYGPSVSPQLWFDDPAFPNNLEPLWRDRFWFIYEQNLAGLYIGEMGLKEEEASNPSSIAYQWFTRWLAYAGHKVHWTYWCWNPNSFDTGGILKDDWVSINWVKYGLIQPYLEPEYGEYTPNPTPPPYTTSTPSPTPYTSSTPSPAPYPTAVPSSPPGDVIIYAEFISSEEDFTYSDDTFKGTNNPVYASGGYDQFGGISNGGLRVYLGGANTNGATSGGWSFSFYSSGDITINLDYRLIFGEGYENDEYGEVIIAVDTTEHILLSVYGDGNEGLIMDTGWRNDTLIINPGSGIHTITIGAFNNKATTTSGEWVDLIIDNVRITEGGTSTPGPTPVPTFPHNDNLGDVNLDGIIDIVDALIIAQFYVGLNPPVFYPDNADTDCNDIIDIVDSLIISQYYVRLINSFCR